VQRRGGEPEDCAEHQPAMHALLEPRKQTGDAELVEPSRNQDTTPRVCKAARLLRLGARRRCQATGGG
jgi:hypothetical protein